MGSLLNVASGGEGILGWEPGLFRMVVLVWWGGGVVGWCSSWCSAAATGEPLDGSSNRFHGAEQKVSFKEEAVGGPVGEGVAGWGFSSCRCTG